MVRNGGGVAAWMRRLGGMGALALLLAAPRAGAQDQTPSSLSAPVAPVVGTSAPAAPTPVPAPVPSVTPGVGASPAVSARGDDKADTGREAALLVETLRDPARRDALIGALNRLAGDAAALPSSSVPVSPAPAAAAPQKAPAPVAAPPAPSSSSAVPGAGDDSGDDDNGPGAGMGDLPARLLTLLTDHIEDVGQQIASAGQALVDTPRALRWLNRQVGEPALRRQWAALLGEVLLVLVAGYVGRLIGVRLLARPRRALESLGGGRGGLLLRLALLVARTLLDSLPVLAFLAAGYGALTATHPPRTMAMAAVGIIMASLLVQAIMLAGRFLLSPGSGALRLVRLGDESANYAYIWLRRVALTAVYGFFIARVAARLGLPLKSYAALLKLVGLAVGGMLVVVVLQNRQDVRDWLRGGRHTPADDLPPEEGALEAALAAEGVAGQAGAPPLPVWRPLTSVRRRLADVWHILTIAYLVVLYGIWALDVRGGFEFVARATLVSLGALVAARLLVEGIDHLIRRGFAIPDDLQSQYPGLEARANRYLPLLERGGKAVIWAAALLVVLQAWGLNSFGWLATPLGQRVMASLVTIAMALTVALMVWEVTSSLIERYLAGLDDGEPGGHGARARTLLPLLRNALLVFLVITVGLIALSALGVDIRPLLAGAGVIGVAVGFGSQTLVKDLITGLFILFEDTIAVGDSVNLGGGLSGVVEGLSIRTLRLRDDTGVLHTIPFSSVTTISNNSKGYAVYALTLAVDVKEETGRVLDVLRRVSAGLVDDPVVGPLILTPPDVLGVAGLGDGAMKVKAVVRTRPGMKEKVGREWNRRIKDTFAAEGISLASSSPTVILAPLAPPQSGQPGSSGGASGVS